MSLSTQFVTIWTMILCGMAIGAAFDVHKIVARQFRLPRWITSGIDFLIWVAAAIFVFVMLYKANYGQLRVYVFLAIMLGVSMYFVLVSWLVQRIVEKLIAVLRFIYRIINRIVRIFVITPIIWLYTLLKMILGFLLVVAMFIYNFVVNLFILIWKMLRRLF